MICRALDSNSDWTFGNASYLSQNPAIAQCIQTKLNTFLGECFFNVTVGVDWWNILGYFNVNTPNLQCSTIILNMNPYGVTGLNTLVLNLNSNRVLTIEYDVLTIYAGNASGVFNVLTDQQGNPLVDNNGNILTG